MMWSGWTAGIEDEVGDGDAAAGWVLGARGPRLQFWVGLGLSALIFLSLFLRHPATFRLLWSAEIWLMVFGGSAMAGWVQFGPQRLWHAVREAFATHPDEGVEQGRRREIATLLLEACIRSRSHGPQAVGVLCEEAERRLAQPEPLLQSALRLLHDGVDPERLHARLWQEAEAQGETLQEQAFILEALAGYAPTMGLMGAMGALAYHLALMGHTPGGTGGAVTLTVLAPRMAEAFCATLTGIVLANLFLLPLAGRLREELRLMHRRHRLIVEGALGVAAGDHPMSLRDPLYLLAHGRPPVVDTPGDFPRQTADAMAGGAVRPVPSQMAASPAKREGVGLVSLLPLARAKTSHPGYRSPQELDRIKEKLYEWRDEQERLKQRDTQEALDVLAEELPS